MTGTRAIVCIDASTPRLVLALGEVDAQNNATFLAGKTRDDSDRRNSALLVPMLEALLRDAGMRMRDIAGFACGVGPGTFTGTRVAVATVKGAAAALNCPTWSVDSLAAIAVQSPIGGPSLALIDARRKEVYAGMYESLPDGSIKTYISPMCGELTSILDSLPHPPTYVAGTGLSLAASQLKQRWPTLTMGPEQCSPQGLWRASVASMTATSGNARTLDVHYLRASYAEIGAHPPKRERYVSPFKDD